MWNAVYHNFGSVYLTQLSGETYKVLASSKEGRKNNGNKNYLAEYFVERLIQKQYKGEVHEIICCESEHVLQKFRKQCNCY
jgi:hypothetical protein